MHPRQMFRQMWGGVVEWVTMVLFMAFSAGITWILGG